MVPRKSDASSSRPDGPGTAADAWRGCRDPRPCPGTSDPLDEARPAGPAQRTRRCSTDGRDRRPYKSPRIRRTRRNRTLGQMDGSPLPNRKAGRSSRDRRRSLHGAVSDRCGGLRGSGVTTSGPPPSSSSNQAYPTPTASAWAARQLRDGGGASARSWGPQAARGINGSWPQGIGGTWPVKAYPVWPGEEGSRKGAKTAVATRDRPVFAPLREVLFFRRLAQRSSACR